MRTIPLLLLAASALAAGCSSPQELTGAAAARSRGAAVTGAGGTSTVPKPADPMLDDARVLARANGKVITLRQIKHAMGPAFQQFLDRPDQLEKFIDRRAKDLVIRQLTLDEAARLGLRPRDEELKRDLEQKEKQAAKDGTTIEQYLIDAGITRREWDDQRREDICFQIADEYFSGYAPEQYYGEESFRPSVDPYVGPDEVRRWGENHREFTDIPESATLRILDLRKDSFGGPGDSEAEKWRLCAGAMDAAEARLRSGEPFADVARALSEGPEAAEGGLLGTVDRTSPLRAEFLEWAFAEATKEADLSPRFRVPTGFVVLLLEEREWARTLPIEEWGPAVRARLEQFRRIYVRAELQIRLLEEASVAPPEFRDSLLDSLQEAAREAREALR